MKKSSFIKSLIILVLIGAVVSQLLTIREEQKQNNGLQLKLDTLQSEHIVIRAERDSLIKISDKLTEFNQEMVLAIEEKDRVIASIKGRYDNVPQDSLGKMMDARARQTH